MEEEEAPDHEDFNIELGSVKGPERERSDGEMWHFISILNIWALLSYRSQSTNWEKSNTLKEIINTFLHISN